MDKNEVIRIATIVGARPQFIKAAAVSRCIKTQNGMEEIQIHTGQHYDHDLSEVFFRELGLDPPRYNLKIGSGKHGLQTGRMLEAIERVLLTETPTLVLVFGDTNSTLAGALAAAKLNIPVAHVEAGLRSFNRRMPEEINRVLVDHVSSLLFAPTPTAVKNLQNEGIDQGRIYLVGDVMYDMALICAEKALQTSRILPRLGVKAGHFILATIHRAENTDDPIRLRAILEGLALVAERIPVVLPVHPRTKSFLNGNQELSGLAERLILTRPVGYLDMVMLERSASLIATDSGGVQKEAFFHRVPCVTLRDETEWVELGQLGWNRIQPPVSAAAVAEGILEGLLAPPGQNANPYGDGSASIQVVQRLLRFVKETT